MFAKPATPAPRYRSRPRPTAAGSALLSLLAVLLLAALAGCSSPQDASGGKSSEALGPGSEQGAQQDQGAAVQDAPAGEGGGSGAAADWTESAGGYVAAENVETADGSAPRASLTLHVPQQRYEEALEEFAALGSVSSLDRGVADVTPRLRRVADLGPVSHRGARFRRVQRRRHCRNAQNQC